MLTLKTYLIGRVPFAFYFMSSCNTPVKACYHLKSFDLRFRLMVKLKLMVFLALKLVILLAFHPHVI